MAIVYKIDIMEALVKAGYSAYYIRKNKILGEATMSRLRNGEMISLDSIDKICALLKTQPGDLIEYIEE